MREEEAQEEKIFECLDFSESMNNVMYSTRKLKSPKWDIDRTET